MITHIRVPTGQLLRVSGLEQGQEKSQSYSEPGFLSPGKT